MAQGTRELLAALRIDPEFEGKIPPLTEAEFAQLRENILEVGEVYEPIRVWNGTVVDGHNRLKVIRENPEIKWQTRDMAFADKWAAFDWMYRNQLGRRNLTDEQRTYMIGKMYEARKKSHGASDGFRGNKMVSSQNANLPNGRTPRTDEIIGKELGVNHSTVVRAEKFAKGVDALRKLSPESADKVLRGQATEKAKSALGNDVEVKVSKQKIAAIAGASPELQQQAAKALEKGEALPAMTVKKPEKTNSERTAQTPYPSNTTESASKESDSEPRSDANAEYVRNPDDPYDVGPSSYSIDDLVEEVRLNGEDYVRGLRTLIETRFPQFDKAVNRMKIRREIDIIINGFTILKEELQ